jgi:hypothetical protein
MADRYWLRDGRVMNSLPDWSPRRFGSIVADPVDAPPLAAARVVRRPRPGKDSTVDLAVPIGGRRRARQALEQAEVLFTTRVAQDGGIGPWRRLTEARFLTARQAFGRGGRLSRSDTAALVVALIDRSMRDRCWVQVESNHDLDWIDFWLYLAHRAFPPYRAEPLFLLAWSAWRLGEPELARSAVDAALVEEPGHHAAAMLKALLRNGVDPGLLPPLSDRCAARGGAR